MDLDKLAPLMERARALEVEMRTIQAQAEKISNTNLKMEIYFSLPKVKTDKEKKENIFDEYGFIKPEFLNEAQNRKIINPFEILSASFLNNKSCKNDDAFYLTVNEKAMLHILGLVLADKMTEHRELKKAIKSLM